MRKKTETNQDTLIDARGLQCPQPLLRARAVLQTLPIGATVCIWATDPHVSIDFHAYCARTGHELLEETSDAGLYQIRLRKSVEIK